ncbi:uncharacterized protein LOC110822811 [Carica papaya]|uniref:uncharacterized protein LOC110822811 n=1 Tax=Carica papaya TaxID=3649 RepID=UPI000B8C7B26|nr:uncharacterized protein LOC110822811 [Carica papaya]
MSPKQDSIPYAPLPQDAPLQNVVVILPSYYRYPPYYHCLRRCLLFIASFLLVAAVVFFLYPSDPNLKLARIHLNHVRFNTSPKLTLDLSFSVTIKVQNRDFFSLDYNSLLVSIGYRGRELGLVSSNGGHVSARGSSYVNAILDLDGLEVIHDVIYLIGDLSRGVIPFDTDTRVKGDLGVFFFKIPLQGKVSCEVDVNVNNQTIVRQDCHPE